MHAHSRITSRQSKRFLERKKARAVLTGILTIVCVTSGVFSFYEFALLPAFSIEHVYVAGADKDIVGQVAAAATSALDGSYLGIFAKMNTLLYPRSSVIAAVLSSSPRVDSVSVSRDGSTGLIVAVNEKKPAALVCTSLPDFSDASQPADDCYFADPSGFIFVAAPTFSGQVYNRYFIPSLADDATSTGKVVGMLATSSAEFSVLQGFYDGARFAGLDVSGILVKDGGEYEMYVRKPSSTDVIVVYFNDARPLHDELVNLASFWKNESDAARVGKGSLDLDYIDIRYGSNVFFRKNQ